MFKNLCGLGWHLAYTVCLSETALLQMPIRTCFGTFGKPQSNPMLTVWNNSNWTVTTQDANVSFQFQTPSLVSPTCMHNIQNWAQQVMSGHCSDKPHSHITVLHYIRQVIFYSFSPILPFFFFFFFLKLLVYSLVLFIFLNQFKCHALGTWWYYECEREIKPRKSVWTCVRQR